MRTTWAGFTAKACAAAPAHAHQTIPAPARSGERLRLLVLLVLLLVLRAQAPPGVARRCGRGGVAAGGLPPRHGTGAGEGNAGLHSPAP